MPLLRSVRFRACLLCLLTAVTACASAGHSGLAPVSAARVLLVDSVAWEDEMSAGTLHRVQVSHGARTDTIPGVLTADAPLLVGDSVVIGFAHEDAAVVGVFEYRLRTRGLRRDSLPGDFHPTFSAPSFAPDARHVAYVVVPGDGTGYAVARSWPGGELVWRSAAVEVPATDAPGGTATRWLSPDIAEAAIETGYSTDGAWYHVRGSVRHRSVISADTLREAPAW